MTVDRVRGAVVPVGSAAARVRERPEVNLGRGEPATTTLRGVAVLIDPGVGVPQGHAGTRARSRAACCRLANPGSRNPHCPTR